MDVAENVLSESEQSTIDIGHLLIAARESKKLSAQDIADQMYLSVGIITKIEANQFEQNIPHAFIRGYLCSYAHKVGLDVKSLSAEFDRVTGFSTNPVKNLNVVSTFTGRKKELNSSSFIIRLVTLIIVISLLIFAGRELWKKRDKPIVNNQANNNPQLVLNGEPTTAESVDAIQGVDELENSQNSKSELFVADDSNKVLGKSAAHEVQAHEVQAHEVQASEELAQKVGSQDVQSQEIQATTIESAAVALQETVADKNIAENKLMKNEDKAQPFVTQESNSLVVMTGVLSFVFKGDCWVEVVDARGEVLATGVKGEGKVMKLEGKAPLSVILGEPTVVELEYQGEAYDLSGYRRGHRAKFILN